MCSQRGGVGATEATDAAQNHKGNEWNHQPKNESAGQRQQHRPQCSLREFHATLETDRQQEIDTETLIERLRQAQVRTEQPRRQANDKKQDDWIQQIS